MVRSAWVERALVGEEDSYHKQAYSRAYTSAKLWEYVTNEEVTVLIAVDSDAATQEYGGVCIRLVNEVCCCSTDIHWRATSRTRLHYVCIAWGFRQYFHDLLLRY